MSLGMSVITWVPFTAGHSRVPHGPGMPCTDCVPTEILGPRAFHEPDFGCDSRRLLHLDPATTDQERSPYLRTRGMFRTSAAFCRCGGEGEARPDPPISIALLMGWTVLATCAPGCEWSPSPFSLAARSYADAVAVGHCPGRWGAPPMRSDPERCRESPGMLTWRTDRRRATKVAARNAVAISRAMTIKSPPALLTPATFDGGTPACA